MGYLGKISGLIAISSGNSSSQIRAVGSEMKQFAATTQRALAQVSSDSVKSFGSIYTEAQKLERALQAASKLELKGLKGFDGKSLGEASEQMRRIHEVAKGLSTPLGNVISTVGKMGEAIQQNLVAPMLAAQEAVEKVELKVAKGGVAPATQFQNAKEKVLEFARAAEFASEAVAAASKISGGGGLKFQQPVLNREFDRGAALQGKVGAFPVLRMTKDVSALLTSQKELSDSAAKMAAAYGAMPTKETAADLQAATAAFQAVNDEINLLIVGYEKLDKQYADSKAAAVAAAAEKIQAAKDEEERIWAIRDAAQAAANERQAAAAKAIAAEEQAAIAAEKRAQQEAAAIAKVKAERASALQQTRAYAATGEVQNIKQLTSAYDQLLTRLRALPDAQRAQVNMASGPSFASVESAISSGDQANVASGASALAQIEVDILNTEKQITAAKEATAAADKKAAQDAAKAKSDAETLLRLEQTRLQIMTGEAQSVSQLKSQYDSVLSRVEKLSAAQRASLKAVLDTNGGMVELAISSGTDADVGAVKTEMGDIEAAVAGVEDLNAKQKEAKKSADALLGLQQGYSQSLSGQSQNIAQLRSTYDGLISRFEKLSAAQRATLAAGGFSISSDKVRQTLASGDDSKVGASQTAIMSMEAAISAVEDLDAKQKAAKKSSDDLRDALSKIGDSIGTPAAPIDQAREAIDRMNAAIEKIKDPTKKANAAAVAAGIRKDIEDEVAISKATGNTPAGSVISGAAAKATSLADATEAINSRKTAKDVFGDVVGSRASQMDQVKASIKSVQSELEKLPIPLQTKFAAELVKVRNMYMNLTPKSTRAEIEAAADAAKKLADKVERVARAQKFSGSFAGFLDDTSAKKYEAELAAVQSKMAAVGATAGGPTAKAIGKYRDALEKAALAGTLGTDKTRAKMQALLGDVEKAVVAEGKLTAAKAKAVFGGIKREGDIGRGGGDKAGLALNQAAYAIDDFMSSTGGVEQKIRAISNNVTQLAFVLGGTAGLWIGLGAVIAAQAAIMVYKFANGGKAAEDTSKALNDALQKQKSIVQELASAYKDLSNEMKLSSSAQAGASSGKALGGIKSANEEFRRSRLMGVNADVVGEMATQSSIDRRMQNATTIGELAYRNELKRQSAARQNSAEASARRGVPGAGGNLEEMKEKRRAVTSTLSNDLEVKLYDLIGAPTWSGKFRNLSGILADLESQIRATEDSMVGLANSASEAAFASAQAGSARIEAANNLLATAIERGVPGALAFQSNLDSLSSEMSSALSSIAAAAAVEDPGQRSTAVAAAQASIAEITKRTAGVIEQTLRPRIEAAFAGQTAGEALGQVAAGPRGARMRASLVAANERAAVEKEKYGNAASQSASARADQTRIKLEGQRRVRESFSAGVELQNEALMYEANPDFFSKKEIDAARSKANAAGDEYRNQVRQAEAENQAAQASIELADAARATARVEYEAAQAASRLQAAIQATAQAMEDFAGRTRKIADDAMSVSTQTADAAQQRFLDKPTEENRQARDDAERQMIADKERLARVDARITQKMSDIQSDPAIAKANEEVRAIDEQIARMQATQAATGVPLDAASLRDAENRRAAAVADRERRQLDLTAPERAAAEAEARDIKRRQREAEEARPEFGREARAAERARVRQGREDAGTARERQVLEASRSAENMAAAAGALGTQAERQAFVQGYFDNQKKEMLKAGPMGQAENERFNAQMSGPSRQALNASDVTTSDGAKELNRLLRGEDSSRDVNFAEMKQQTELLQVIADGIKAATGIAVQF